MTAIAMNYVVNPFKKMWSTLQYAIELQGMARAARELHRLGYSKEAEQIYQRMRTIVCETE
jgi:hypothetical protein